jgi:hypothetical protein
MVPYLPTGTFFGLLAYDIVGRPWPAAASPTGQAPPAAVSPASPAASPEGPDRALGTYLAAGGLLMLHSPLMLLMLNFWMQGLPLDMVYPYLTGVLMHGWEVYCYVMAALLGAQVVVGVVARRGPAPAWLAPVAKACALVMSLSFAVPLAWLLVFVGPELGLAGAAAWVMLAPGLLLGLLLNPLGLYFGAGVFKILRAR